MAWTLIVSACGGKKTNDFTEVVDIGFPSKYVPPLSNFEDQETHIIKF